MRIPIYTAAGWFVALSYRADIRYLFGPFASEEQAERWSELLWKQFAMDGETVTVIQAVDPKSMGLE